MTAPGENAAPAGLPGLTGLPVLDPAPVRRLAETFAAEAPTLLAEIVTAFLEDSPGHLAALQAAVANEDAGAARRAAHTLKSNAATLGAVRLEAAAGEVERRAAGGDLTGAGAGVPVLEREYDPAAAALLDLRDRAEAAEQAGNASERR